MLKGKYIRLRVGCKKNVNQKMFYIVMYKVYSNVEIDLLVFQMSWDALDYCLIHFCCCDCQVFRY